MKSLLVGLIAIYSCLLACVVWADVPVTVNFPDRKECRSSFESHWDKGFAVSMQQFKIYNQGREALRKEIDTLLAQRLWDSCLIDSICPIPHSAEGKVLAGALDLISYAATLLRKSAKSASDAVEIARSKQIERLSEHSEKASEITQNWTLKKLQSGESVSGIVSSYVSAEFLQYVAVEATTHLVPPIEAIKVFGEALVSGFESDAAYKNYIRSLNDSLKFLQDQINQNEVNLLAERGRLRNTIENGTTIFCANEPPIANTDTPPDVLGRSYVDVYVLRNDTDPENLPLALSGIISVTGGRANIMDGGGSGIPEDHFIRFVASAGFSGPAEVRYSIKDDLGLQSSGTIRINVVPDPSLADDFQNDLESILADSIHSFDREWSESAEVRLSELERKLEIAVGLMPEYDHRQGSFLGAVLELAKIGRDYKDLQAIECAEAMLNGQESRSCQKFGQAVAEEELARAMRRSNESATNTESLGGLKDFTDPNPPDGAGNECERLRNKACPNNVYVRSDSRYAAAQAREDKCNAEIQRNIAAYCN